ncbi:hypothetical protein [Streptomyces sp. NPDC059970]|uniref:hypothetical protein n=1 Tax=Streptomyces sp. NPDC059970 TaxID=3347019 RepID=UPI00367401F9
MISRDTRELRALAARSPRRPTASELLRPLLGQSTAAFHAVAAEEFTAPFNDYKADLLTCARAFHWMDRSAALAMADRVTTLEAATEASGHTRRSGPRP